MSTTLVPPSHYVVKPRGQTARVFPSLAQAAAALGYRNARPDAVITADESTWAEIAS